MIFDPGSLPEIRKSVFFETAEEALAKFFLDLCKSVLHSASKFEKHFRKAQVGDWVIKSRKLQWTWTGNNIQGTKIGDTTRG